MADDHDNEYALFYEHLLRYSNITREDWLMLLPHLTIRQLQKNELFIKEGNYGKEIGFVLEGMLRQYYTRDGEEKTTYFFFEHHFISAYISCITQQPSLVTIEALSDTRYISFPYSVMAGLFNNSIGWQQFGRRIAEYLFLGLEERMVSLLLQSPEERYLSLLSGNKRKIMERVPQHYIANYLGITPVSMSRIRSRLLKK